MIVDGMPKKPFGLQQNPNRRDLSVDSSTMDIEAGPVLNAKKRGVVEAFVKKVDGKRVIQRILIANNGMAATKSILSMRQWAYMTLGDERAIEFVAMATRDDLNANAEFIRLADSFVEVPSGSNKNNYANVDLIVKIAEEQKVDAVWPGWGHASENPRLPNTLKTKGIQFIGPTGPVMAALGDKVSANILAQTAKVPSIPWSGDGITSDLNAEGVIPQEVFNKACVFNVNDAMASAEKIGYPVMIKASEGGGGKGIRMAKNLEELKTNFIQVQNEVPGSPVFMMQLCTQARHLEVQIIGDEYGNAVALNGRDCSTQRRFQKIFEEGPPTIAPRDVFRQMELSAQRLTQSIGYIGAGTVEYLYNAEQNKYYFLELNPRLQVEHPVTEGLTGVNLPSVQLQVAMGIALDRIPEIRQFYGRDVNGKDHIDFFKDEYVYPDKHVIAARITAENPDEGFKPTSGRIERVKFQSSPRVWGYFSVGANGGIHEFADSQFGHLFASGPTREDARKALVLALKEIDVRGDIRSSVEYLIKLLETQEFKDNTIDTSWLDGIIREKSVSVLLEPHTVALSAAIFRAHTLVKSQTEELIQALGKGQTSLQSIANMLNFPVEITYDNVKYQFTVNTLGPNIYSVNINGQNVEVRIREQPDKSLLCSVGGESYQLFGQEEPLGLRMKINGVTIVIPTVYNPSELRSDVTGKIVRFLQQDGEAIEKDKPYVEVEAMKMIMAIKATEDGVINHNLSPGSIISAGDLIASVKLKDPSKVKQITTFRGVLSTVPVAEALTVDGAKEQIGLAVDGFIHNTDVALQQFLASAKLDDITSFIATQLQKYVDIETQFSGKEESAVISALAKTNKDKLATITPTLVARKQLKSRTTAINSLLRQLEFLPERFVGSYSPEKLPEDLKGLLASLAVLDGVSYKDLSLKAKQLLDEAAVPPFQTRLDALKASVKSSSDLASLATQPNIAVSVDLLVVLMSDSDAAVRKAAVEVYLRRVYRAHNIKSLEIAETNGVLSAKWTFQVRDTSDKAPIRHGFMSMLPDFDNINSVLPGVIVAAGPALPKGSYSEALNVLHIGFSKYGDKTEDECSKIAKEAIAGYKSQLSAMDVRAVNFLTVKPGKKVSYFNYFAESNYQEDIVSRNMRPTMPQLLELNRLVENHDLSRLPTVGRNSQLYIGTPKVDVKGKKSDQQYLFLRSISNTAETVSHDGAERVLLLAMDELDRALLDSRVSDSVSSRVFLNILPDATMDVKEGIELFQRSMDTLVSKYATRLLKLRVDEIEVKVRVKDPKEGIIPVRLIASSAEGGWLTRMAYREYLDPVSGQTTQYCPLIGNQDMCVLDPYPAAGALQFKRSNARRVGSTYAYDFLGLMEVALINSWQSYLDNSGGVPPANLFKSDELVLGADNVLRKEKRVPGSNKVGMLAWHCTMKTPQYPDGRDIVIIANDVTGNTYYAYYINANTNTNTTTTYNSPIWILRRS